MALYTTAIQKLYVAYFSRPADAGGLDWWESVVANAKGDTSMISAEFAASNEYKTTFANKSNYEIVRTVYSNLFGREAEPAGIEYWASALDKRVVTIDAVVTAIAGGAQGSDLKAFDNKVIAATEFTKALDTYPERTAYNGEEALAAARAFTKTVTTDASLAAAIAPAALAATVAAFVEASRAPMAFTLTAGLDAGVAFTGGGGSDIFHARSGTLGAGDTLKGGGGSDTLSLDDASGPGLNAFPAGASTSGIENFVGRSGAGFGTASAAYDLGGQADLTNLSLAARGAVNVKIGDAVTASIVTTAGAVTVTGGKSIFVSGNTGVATLTGNAITTVALQNTSQNATIANATAGHTLNLTLDAVTGGATITDAEAATVNLTATPLMASIPENPLPHPTAVNVNLDMAKATALNISNAGKLTLVTTALAGADMLQSITLTGTGGAQPTVSDILNPYGSMQADLSGILPFKSFDASAYTGSTDVKIASATNLSVKGGHGADRIVMTGPLAGSASVQLGAGDDVYDFSRAAQQGAKVDGGAGGNDTMIVNDSVLLDTEGQVFTNFETLIFSSGKGEYNLDKAGSVTRLDASKVLREDVDFINGRANSSINLMAEATNLDLDGKPVADFVPHANISFKLKDASGSSDVLAISLTAQDTLADRQANGVVQAASIEAKDIETINLHSQVNVREVDIASTPINEAIGAADYANAISYLYIDGAKTLKLTGNASLDLTAIYSSTLTLFDATGSSGNIDFGGVVNTSETVLTRLTYLGSNGKDEIEGPDVGIVFQGNGGADEVMLHREADVADVIRFTKASDSFLVLGADKVTDAMDTYSFFQSGVDKIDLSGLQLANGANRAGFASYNMFSNNYSALGTIIGTGAGFFNDGGTNRSLAFGKHGDTDCFVMVDVNSDGNFTGGVDLIFNMYGSTEMPKLTDFLWG